MTASIFVPFQCFVTALTLGTETTATFSHDHAFTVGEYVSFRVSPPFGTFEINNQRGHVLAITSNTITVDIDSRLYTPFIYPVSGKVTPPVCVPAGSGILPGAIPTQTTLIDVFDNQPG